MVGRARRCAIVATWDALKCACDADDEVDEFDRFCRVSPERSIRIFMTRATRSRAIGQRLCGARDPLEAATRLGMRYALGVLWRKGWRRVPLVFERRTAQGQVGACSGLAVFSDQHPATGLG